MSTGAPIDGAGVVLLDEYVGRARFGRVAYRGLRGVANLNVLLLRALTADDCAAAGSCANFKGCADGLCAQFHEAQAKAGCGLRGVLDTDAIVLDFHLDLLRCHTDAHVKVCGVRMLQRVGDGFLYHAVE